MPLAVLSFLLGLVLIVVGVTQANLWIKSRRRPVPRQERLVENLTDPRDASAILFVHIAALAAPGGVPSSFVLSQTMQSRFDLAQDEADELAEFGRMAILQIRDVPGSLPQILRPIREICTAAEKNSIIHMLNEMAGDEPGVMQARFLTQVNAALHLESKE